MGEKNLWSKLGLIALLVGLCLWQIYPPSQRLKPGIDLGGGHSLTFEIDDSGDTGFGGNLAERVMSVLKQRVDPQGSRNLIWRPIGSNRLEIQMPRPPAQQAEQRQAYEEARQALADTAITAAEIRSALVLPPDQRKQQFDEMVGIVESRAPLFDQLAEVYDKYEQMTAATTQPSGEEAREMDRLLTERNQLIDELVNTNVDVRVVTDLLELGKESPVRQERLAEMKESHDDLAPLVEDLVEAHDVYAETKGALDDPSDLMRLLRGAGKLEFRILARPDPGNPSMLDAEKPAYRESIQKYKDQLERYGPRRLEGDNYVWLELHKPEENDVADPAAGYVLGEYLGTKYVLAHATEDMALINKGDDAWSLTGAAPGRDQMGALAVNFQLDIRGGEKFGQLTENNVGRPMAIVLDGQVMSAATIRSRIGTSGQISGEFTESDVFYLVNTLEAGVLPARVKPTPLQQKSVGPQLGETNRKRGAQAVVVALLLTIAFMTVYYMYNGFIADIALLMNLVITLGVMSFIQATFTLPGIAGLVLMLGMAVDANVLIYERIREELNRGVSVRMAVKLGYEKAFSAILDSNVTTIITAIILGSLGSEEIKGFGLTLGIGLVTSMFTALFVTRQYFNIMVPSTLNKSEVNRSWLACGILAVIGGAIFAIGWLINSGAEKPWEGGLAAFGMFLLVLFAVGAVLLLSLWLFRIVYRSLGHQKANRLPMLRLLGVPKINWMGMYKTFWSISAVLIVAGYIFFEVEIQRPQDFFDIEFVGGTSVQVELEDEEELPADIQEAIATAPDRFLLNRVSTDDVDDPDTSVGWLHQAADRIEQANVADLDNQRYRVETDLTTAQTEALIMADDRIAELLTRGGVSDDPQGVVMQFSLDKAEAREITLDQARVREMLDDVAQRARIAADKLRGSRVQLVEETLPDGSVRTAFEIITTETSKQLVAQALIASMRDILQVTQPIEATLRDDPIRAPDGLFPIKTVDNTIADVTGGEIQDEIAEFKGGVLLVFDELQPPATVAEVEQRITEMRLQPDFADVSAQDFKVVGLTPDAEASEKGAPRFKSVAVALVDPNLTYVEGDENAAWRTDFAEKQKDLVQAALASSRSLQRVTQFAPQVASEATQKAVIAIILSLIAIAGYLWVRFGSIEFGLAGIIALFHDVSITLSAVMLCHFVHDTFIGKLLLLEDFKIDLAMIAAFLTIVGYSINDSIVIFDRIRENRGRLATVSATLINDSLNQTLSRTIITSATTFIAVFAMYIIGGSGIHGFAFALLVGVLSGTYSTIAIATPMLQHPRAMWVVTVAIISMMVIGIIISATSGIAGLMWGLIALVLAAAAYAIYRVMTSEATAARPTTA